MPAKIENPNEFLSLPIFSEMNAVELEKIIKYSFIKKYAAGQTIFVEGMAGEIMYVILSGKVEIYKHKGFEELPLVRLGAGEFIGEGSLVLEGKRSTSCRIIDDAELLVISKKAFQNLAETDPAISTKLLRQFLKTNIMRLRSTHLGTD